MGTDILNQYTIHYGTPTTEVSATQNNGGFGEGLVYLGKEFVGGVGSVFEGIGNLVDAMEYKDDPARLQYEMSKSELQHWLQNERNEFNPSKGWEFAGGVSAGIGQSAVYMGISAATSFIPGVGPALGRALVFGAASASATGNALAGKIQEGHELDGNLWGYALTVGVTEGGVEVLTNNAGKAASRIVGGAAKESVKAASGTVLGNFIVRGLARVGYEGGTEGLEEGISYVVDYWAQKWYGINPNAKFSFGEMMYNVAVGVVSGSVMSGGSSIIGDSRSIASGHLALKKGTGDNIVRVADNYLTDFTPSNNSNEYLNGLYKTYNRYQALENKTGTEAKLLLGQMNAYNGVIAISDGVLESEADILFSMKRDPNTTAAQVNALMSTNYTAEEIKNNKDHILEYAASAAFANKFVTPKRIEVALNEASEQAKEHPIAFEGKLPEMNSGDVTYFNLENGDVAYVARSGNSYRVAVSDSSGEYVKHTNFMSKKEALATLKSTVANSKSATESSTKSSTKKQTKKTEKKAEKTNEKAGKKSEKSKEKAADVKSDEKSAEKTEEKPKSEKKEKAPAEKAEAKTDAKEESAAVKKKEKSAEGEVAKFSLEKSKNGLANDALSGYDEELTRLIGERGDYIIDSYEKLRQVVDIAFDEPSHKATAYFGIVKSDTLQKTKNDVPNLPKEIEGALFKEGRDYSIAVTLDGIRHLVDEKGMDREDVLDYLNRLSDTILEYDSVAFDYYIKGKSKTPGLLFKKRFSDGTLFSFNLVSQKKRGLILQALYLDSANYQKKKSAKTLLMQKANSNTSETQVGQTSDNSISHSDEKNNPQTEKSLETAKHSLDDTQKAQLMAAANGEKSALKAIAESDTELLGLMQADSELQARKRAANEDYRVNEDENTPAKENATEAKNKALTEIEESTDEDVDLDLTEDVEDTAETVTEETTEEATVDEAIEEETAEEYRDNYTAAEKEFARKLMSRPKNFDLLPYETRKNILDMVRSAKGVDKDSIQYAATLMERRFGLRIEFGNYKNKGLHFQSGNGRRLMLVRSSDANHALIHELWHELYKTDAGQKIVSDLKGSEIVKGYEDDYATRYKQHTGKEISDELKTEEGIGDLLAEKLNDIRFVKRFASSQRGFFMKAIGFLSDLMADIKNVKNPVYRDARRLEKTFIEGIGRYTYEDAYAEEARRILEAFEEIEADESVTENRTPKLSVEIQPKWIEDVENTVELAIREKGKIGEKYNQKTISAVPNQISDVVSLASAGEIDISNKRIALQGDDIWHEFRGHSTEEEVTSRGQIAFTKKTFAEAVLAIYDPDIVECLFADKNNPTQRQSFAYAKKTDGGNFVVVEAVGGKNNPNVVPVMILHINQEKWNRWISAGKTFGEMLYENDPAKFNALDVEFNKKNRVTVAQFASKEAIANTPHSPRFNNSIPDPTEKSNTFSKNSLENFSAKHSLDSDYLSAVENGDMETAQAMVDQAAKDAGYTIKSYHGTLAKDFTEFKKSFIGSRFNYDDKGFFFIDRKSIAEDYATSAYDRNMKGRVLEVYLRVKKPLLVDKAFCLREGLGNPFRDDDAIGVWDAYLEFFKDEAAARKADGIILDDGMSKMTVVFDGEQIKSADPVTYDDDGNVIPLSRRFDRTKRDIRYSLDSALESSLESTGVGAEKGYREGFRGKAKTMMIGARIAFFDAYAGVIDYFVKQGGYTQQEAETIVQKARMGASRGKGAIESGQLVDGKVEESLISILRPIYEKGEQEKEFFFNYLEHKHNIDRMSLYDKSMAELSKIGKEYRAVHQRILPLRDQIKALEESGNTGEVNELYKKLDKLVKRSIRLKAQMDNFVVEENKPVFGVNEERTEAITAEESRKAVEQYEKERPEFIDIAKKLYKFNDNLMKVRVEAGLITQADADRPWARADAVDLSEYSRKSVTNYKDLENDKSMWDPTYEDGDNICEQSYFR